MENITLAQIRRNSGKKPTSNDEKLHAARNVLSEIVKKDHKQGWEEAWKKGIKPWDAGKSAPALVELLEKNRIPEGKALVPGCGTGYDLVTLASPTRSVLGIELSETAAGVAREYLKSKGLPADRAEVLVADFFELNLPGQFDFIYDYTFLAAMMPQMRVPWAQQMSKLLKPETGLLMTLIFPVDLTGSEGEHGPPFAIKPELYRELLEPHGFVCQELKPAEKSFTARQGREWIGLWTKPSKSKL